MNKLARRMKGMAQGRAWSLMGDGDAVRQRLDRVYDERYHRALHHKYRFQLRVNLQRKDDAASYAGWITTFGRRRVRLILASVPFGYRSPNEQDRCVRTFRELLVA